MSIKTTKCSVCSGTGVIERLANYAGYHYHQEEPIIETDCCDECGGEGIIKIDDPIKTVEDLVRYIREGQYGFGHRVDDLHTEAECIEAVNNFMLNQSKDSEYSDAFFDDRG